MSVPAVVDEGAAPGDERRERPRAHRGSTRRMLGLGLVVTAAALGLAALGRSATPLPIYGDLPAFRLVSQSGRPFGTADLTGRPFIAGFIFTRCPTVCPVTTAAMARMQEELGARAPHGAVRLVSFSVDPTYDTPERLAVYAQKHGVDPGVWTFVTGDLGAVTQTVTEGLKTAMADLVPGGSTETDFSGVLHGTHFVLVDGAGRLRGFYASGDAGVVERVVADAVRLTSERGS